MYIQTLAPKTKELINTLSKKISDNFYLSGGTALALHLGHRESEDLDFFSEKQFDPSILQQHLLAIQTATLENTSISEGTLNTYINTVKVQFLYYPYALLEKNIVWQGFNVSSVLDIACTKIITISMRGSKKDFVDLYFILQQYNLSDLFSYVAKKYKDIQYNNQHLLKSLVYFEDADQQPMPRMHKDVSWEEVKETIINSTKQLSSNI